MSRAWNLVPRPTFADVTVTPWHRSNGDPATIGGTDPRGNPYPRDAIRIAGGFTERDGIVALDVHGDPADVVTVYVERAGIGGSGQIEAHLHEGASDGPEVGNRSYPPTENRDTRALAIDVDPHTGPLWLRLAAINGETAVYGVRAHYGESDEHGIFSGDDEPAATGEEPGHAWTDEPWASASYYGTLDNGDDDGDDDGDPDHDELAEDLAPRVARYVGRAGDQQTVETAAGQVPIVAEFVRGYTRDNGWDDDYPVPALRAVIVAATGRLVLNPEQVRQYSAGDYSETPAVLLGFTLAEQYVLNRYRRRWA